MNNLIDRISKCESLSRELDLDATEREQLNKQILAYADKFYHDLPQAKVFEKNSDNGFGITQQKIGENPADFTLLLELLNKHVDSIGANPASGNYCGYIPGGGIYTSALADYLSSVTNRYTSLFLTAPGAVYMEKMLIEWTCQLMGYDKSAYGVFTSGGSLATLTALVTARTVRNIKAAAIPRTVIYLTSQTHHCFAKGLHVTGLNEAIQRNIPLDKDYRMDADALKKAILNDLKNGLEPWLIVASAGTVHCGAIDPLAELSVIAKEYNLWLHVDAAYGGFFTLTSSGKDLFAGIQHADSIVLDPHKGLFLSYGLGLLLVKKHQDLLLTHQYTATILQDSAMEDEAYSSVNLSAEMTRPFRSLRMWLSLQLFGVKRFRATLEEKLLLAQYFYQEIQKLPNIEFACEPKLSVVAFRFKPQSGDADAYNERIYQSIMSEGKVLLSTTTLEGKYFLRFACLCFRTHRENVDIILGCLKKLVNLL